MSDQWTIVQLGFDPRTAKAYEGLFTLGSDCLHVRGALEEPLAAAPQDETYWRLPANVTSEAMRHPLSRWGTFVPGIYGPHPLLGNELINLPWFLGLVPVVEGERLDAGRCDLRAAGRALRLSDATLERGFVWHARCGARLAARFERFVSAARPRLCVQRLTLTADRPVTLEIEAGIDGRVTTNGFDHFRGLRFGPLGADALGCLVETDGGDRVEIVRRARLAQRHFRCAVVGRAAALLTGTLLEADEAWVVETRTAVTTSRDRARTSAEAVLAAAEGLTYAELHAEHAAVWKRRWEACDVRIEGDGRSQLALRTALFHLLRAHPGVGADEGWPMDRPLAIDAKGYAGEAYWGRFFWDTEMFMLPFFLYTDPPRARALLDFRVHTLDGARRNARRYGYAGARYAWESDADGVECCPNWQYADHEVHVTADVAYALAHYARATGEADYLRGPAARVLVETARYWMERIDWRPDDDATAPDAPLAPALLCVMGPDEYTPFRDNNAYTNRLVAFALALAAEVGAAGGASDEERRAFAETAARLPIPRSADGTLVLQCEGWERLAEPRFERHWRDRSRTFAAQVSQERLYRTRCLKQADVLMLMMLFPHEFSDAQVRTAWEHYLPCTTHDSSLSAGVHAIVALRLGLVDVAWDFWLQASGLDLDVDRGGAAEGVHVANCGAVWQMAVLGFAGMRTALQSDVLTLDPKLPPTWSRLAFPAVWRGCPVFVDIQRDGTRVGNRGRDVLRVVVDGREQSVAGGSTACWAASG